MPILKVFTRNIHNDIDPAPAEICHIPDRYSFHQYLTEFVPAYTSECDFLFSLHVNGEHWEPIRWREILPQDAICEAVRAPQGAEVIIPLVIATLSAAWSFYQMSKLEVPDNYNSTAPTSSSIYGANAQANTVRLMSPTTELFGRHSIVPDYLSAPHREYIAQEEWLHLFLRVTAGECVLNNSDIFIGDTQLSTLGADASFSVFAPGASVVGERAAEHWYSVDEVAGQGVELKGALPVFSYQPPYTEGDYTYLWVVQPDTKQLKMGQYIVQESSLQYAGTVDWKSFFNDAGYSKTSLIGVVLSIWTGSQYEYFRCVDDAYTATFARVDSTTWEIDQSWSGFGTDGDIFTGFYSIVQSADDWGDWAGWFNCTPPGKTTDNLRFNFHFPQGLCELDNKNIPQTRSVTVTLEYRDGPSGTVLTRDYAFSEGTLNARGYTREFSVSNGAWQARVKFKTITHNASTTKELLYWNGMASELPTRSSYPEFTTLSVSIKGTHRLSQSASDKVRVIPTRKLPELQYTGGEYSMTAPVATRNPVAAALHILSESDNPDTRIDLAEFYRLQVLFDSRNDYFDGAFDQSTTSWQALKRVLAVGRTHPITEGGKVVPVRDEWRDDPAWFFTEDNVLSDFEFNAELPTSGGTDIFDGAEVEYMNPDTWKPDTILCTLPGETGHNPSRLRAYGVTDRNKAYQYGMGNLARDRYRDLIIGFQASLEGTRVSYLDAAEIGWTIPGQSQTGIVLGKDGLTLQLSEPLNWKEGETHVIKIRTREGKVSDAIEVTQGQTDQSVILASDVSFEMTLTGREEPPLFMFGVAEEVSLRMLIKKSALSGTERAKVTTMLDDVRAYQYDDAIAPS
jgi:hypothetical protein